MTENNLRPETGLEALVSGSVLSPFTRLRKLLDGVAPGKLPEIQMTIGEPRESMPAFVVEKIREAEALFANYPKIQGTDALRQAIGDWLARRYDLIDGIDSESEILPLNGSREGLYFAALPAVGRKKTNNSHPAIALCNPYYATYIGAILGVNAEPVYLNATAETGHLPDLDRLANDDALLERLAALYIASPANPQGVVASSDYIRKAIALARHHDFMLFFDECYSEIYVDAPPTGALEIAATTNARFKNVVVFNSLSKRSNLPGLRSGFCAGDGEFLDTFREIRNLVSPQIPGPIQHASAAIWADEKHVAATRAAYGAKFAICDEVLAGRFGYQRPDAGFFLWLDMAHFGGGSDATVTLWKDAGVKVLPGAFLARADGEGINPGDRYIRMALVHDPETVRESLERMVKVFA